MPIKYDKNIKKPHQKLEYTSEMIQELEKCSEDFFYFCKYVKVRHPDKGRITYVPR
jgi:hypothetical protein